jgi:hypothetical protein
MAVKRFVSDGLPAETPPHGTQMPVPGPIRLARLTEAIVAHRAEIGDDVVAGISTKPGGPPSGLWAEQLRGHVLQHVDEFVRLVQTGRLPVSSDLGFVLDVARATVTGNIDVRHLLEVYRVCPQIKSKWIVRLGADISEPPEVALHMVQLLMDYSLHVSRVVVEAYLECLSLETDPDVMTARLVADLMEGAAGPQAVQRLRQLGIEPGSPHQLGVVSAPDLRAAHEAMRRRLLLLRRSAHLAAVWTDHLVVLAPADVILSDVLKQVANRIPLRAGISLPFSDLQSLGEARNEAEQALALAGERQVVRLSKVRLFDYLLACPGATTLKLVPAGLRELDEVHRATLRFFALANLNAEQAARALGVHANTVTYRLRKVQELTGLDVRRLEDLIDLLAGMRILDVTDGYGQQA